MAPIEPDMTLLAELYEEIERNPPAIEARKLLVEQFITAEWMDSVRSDVEELRTMVPKDEQVQQWYNAFCQQKATPSGTTATASKFLMKKSANPAYSIAPAKLPSSATDLASEKTSLVNGYRLFQSKAKALLRDLKLLQNLQSRKGTIGIDRDRRAELEALADGRITTVLLSQEPTEKSASDSIRAPDSARSVAAKMKAKPGDAFAIAMSDLEDMIPWLRSIWKKPAPPDEDALRELLVKRVRITESALPPELQMHVQTALMHMEHEQLKRSYVNDETMYGDAVADIPRENFLATEDNYAWDMEELAAAMQTNRGVLRNPLSKFMFTPMDVKAILAHPLGLPLAALEVEQARLKQGVRPDTMDQMEKMAKTLLLDMDESAKDSREAVDEFIAYIATLPSKEQEALDNLRIPAKDSHTRQAFDGSIGDTIRDSKANKLCFHKAGDFLQQAAKHLRKSR